MRGEVALSSDSGSARARLSAWVTRSRPSLTILAVEVILHAWVALIVLLPDDLGPQLYATEYVFCVSLAAIIAPASFFVREVFLFRGLILGRLGIVLAALNILGPTLPIVWVLLILTLVIEIFAYDQGMGSTFVLGVVLFACFSSVLLRGVLPDTQGGIAFAGSVIICTSLVSVVIGLSGRYRERLVERTKRVRTLEATVANLANANKAFQSYAGHLESESTERERSRITRELHDTIGYALTNVIVMMNAGKILLNDDPEELRSVLDRVSAQSEVALNDIRRTLHHMATIREPELTGLKAIYNLTGAFQGAMGVTVTVSRGNFPWTLGQRLDEIVFRVVQEGLTNAFRHGKATEVMVFFWRAPDEIRVRVRDNGRGVPFAKHEEGIGLKGIRTRLDECGGTLRTRGLSVGFEMEVRIPFSVTNRRTYKQGSGDESDQDVDRG